MEGSLRRDPVVLRMTRRVRHPKEPQNPERSRLVIEDVEEVGRLIIDYCYPSLDSLAPQTQLSGYHTKKRGERLGNQ